MTKRLESKYKISRRIGESLWGTAKDPVNKRNYAPGQHGMARKRKLGGYAQQLNEKQKLRGYYGNITERQFRKIYAEAARRKGDTSENLVGLLERRLDAVIYRMNIVPTVFAARQFVSHGHIKVNGKRVNVPSYSVKEGDEIEVRDSSKQKEIVVVAMGKKERSIPEYIEFDEKAVKGKFVRVPKLAEIPYAVQMQPNLVVEFYSR
jgi:small subunit ribosomal protein S4